MHIAHGRACAGQVLAILLALAPSAQAIQDQGGEVRPGLLLTYRAQDGVTPLHESVDRTVSHEFGMVRPHELVPVDGIRADWVGELWTPRSTVYELELRSGAGDATEIVIDGEPVDGPLDLERGNHLIELRWRHTQGHARVQFLWSYAGRRVEVVPHWALSHVPSATRELVGELFDRGRRLAESLRCGACHGGGAAKSAPAIHGVPGQLREDWLRAYLLDPIGTQPHTVKRELLPNSPRGRAEAQALVRFLTQGLSAEGEQQAGTSVPTDRGRRRFQSLGCFTCHPQSDAWARATHPGASLRHLAGKMDRKRLEAILRRPHEMLPSGRMPDFHLGEDDVATLTGFLLGEDPIAPPPVGFEVGDEGLAILAQEFPTVQEEGLSGESAWVAYGKLVAWIRRCDACHTLPTGMRSLDPLPPLEKARTDHGCLADVVSGISAPGRIAFRLDDEDRRALRTYVAGLNAAEAVADETRLEREVERLGCLACHARDGSTPTWTLASEVTQLPKTIHFPDLSAVGVKLRRDWLTDVLAAPTDSNRVWRVSPAPMPDYHLDPAKARELSEHFARRDRVRLADVDAPLPEVTELSGDELDQSLADVGRRGSACFSCHLLPQSSVQFGMAYDAIGPDLSQSRSRLRREWVSDWLRDPALTHPATRMPSIGEPADDALRDRLWNYLVAGLPSAEDALRWEVPLDLSAEGPVFVHALVKRDEALGLMQHHPRSLLVVLENGVSVLFDIDRLATVALWGRGSFAYRVHGRSRYWASLEPVDWAGEDVASALALIDGDGVAHPAELEPALGRMPSRLLGFDVQEHAFSVHYRITDDRGQALTITETFAPAPLAIGVGVDRTLLIEGIPEGERVRLSTCFGEGSVPVLVDDVGGNAVELPASGVPAIGKRLASTGRSGCRVTRQLVGLTSPSAAWFRNSCPGGRGEGHPAASLELDPRSDSALSVRVRILVLPLEE